jgi:hypothetical protein
MKKLLDKKYDITMFTLTCAFFLSLKFGPNLLGAVFVVSLLTFILRSAFDFVIRIRQQAIKFSMIVRPMIVLLNTASVTYYTVIFCKLKIENLPSFGDDQSTFLNVIGRVGANTPNSQFTEGGTVTYIYFLLMNRFASLSNSSQFNHSIYSLYLSWVFGLILLIFAGSIAVVSMMTLRRKNSAYLVFVLLFVVFCLIFLSVSLALFLSDITCSYVYGFLIVSGIYAVLVILLIYLKPVFIDKLILRNLSEIIFDD